MYIVSSILRKLFLVFESIIIVIKRFKPFIKFRIKFIPIGFIIEIIMSLIIKMYEPEPGIIFILFKVNVVAVFGRNNFIIKAMQYHNGGITL